MTGPADDSDHGDEFQCKKLGSVVKAVACHTGVGMSRLLWFLSDDRISGLDILTSS